MERPGTWWDGPTWLASHCPPPGGVLSPEEWHYKFMSGMYLGALYGPLFRGGRGWVCRLRTSLQDIEYWAYVPNNTRDPMEWYTVHSDGYTRRNPTKQLTMGVSGLFDVLPLNGGEVLGALMLEPPMAIEAGAWAWWAAQALPKRYLLYHLPWVAGYGPYDPILLADIRASAVAVARGLNPENYARYAARLERALQRLRKISPGLFYEVGT